MPLGFDRNAMGQPRLQDRAICGYGICGLSQCLTKQDAEKKKLETRTRHQNTSKANEVWLSVVECLGEGGTAARRLNGLLHVGTVSARLFGGNAAKEHDGRR